MISSLMIVYNEQFEGPSKLNQFSLEIYNNLNILSLVKDQYSKRLHFFPHSVVENKTPLPVILKNLNS